MEIGLKHASGPVLHPHFRSMCTGKKINSDTKVIGWKKVQTIKVGFTISFNRFS